jgi:peptidoglycan/xylan/chitin deacetylase (PgdA/CDA1 family)
MIFVRDDDVLVNSSGYTDKRKTPLERLKQIHRWICDTPKLLHVPTLVVEPLMAHPEAVKFIREETEAGRMAPEIHGFQHIDYGKLKKDKVIVDLMVCKEFLLKEIGVEAKKWYTPWGGNSSTLRQCASQCGLELIDVSDINPPSAIMRRANAGENIEVFMEGKEIFVHWWERGMRLKRIIEILKHGSVEAAKQANDWF